MATSGDRPNSPNEYSFNVFLGVVLPQCSGALASRNSHFGTLASGLTVADVTPEIGFPTPSWQNVKTGSGS
jgi:hypothetical protein